MYWKKLKNKIILILVLVILSLIFQNNLTYFKISREYIGNDIDSVVLTKSGYWDENFIHIDNNWSLTEQNKPWCSGSGTWNDPYMIENLTVDGQNMGDSIIIENSEDYFIMNNCTVFNSEKSSDYAGIKMSNTSNSIIMNCLIFNNYHGISLNNGSVNNTIIGNNISLNGDGSVGFGIYLYENCDYNIILSNIASNNDDHGIYIYKDCDFNNISYNIIRDNGDIGMRINSQCHNNTISKNLIENNQYETLSISFSNGVKITENSIKLPQEPNRNGLTLFMCDFTEIIRNDISNNTGTGLYVQMCDSLLITENIILGNDRGIEISSGSQINIFKNAFIANNDSVLNSVILANWNNSIIGNYWSDHISSDNNRDGICDTYYSVNGGGTDYFSIFGNPVHNGSKIHIDDSNSSGDGAWKWASTRLWCSGSGIFSDPYIIVDLIIDGDNSESCILIENSEKYFQIRNCTLFNSGGSSTDSGIHLNSVTNSTLINNNVSFNNGFGMYISGHYSKDQDNNSIIDNIVQNNTKQGIYIENSNLSRLYDNIIYNNGMNGMYILSCNDCNVSRNIAILNGENGMYIFRCDNLSIKWNEIRNNTLNGIYLEDNNDNCSFSNNIVAENNADGLVIDKSEDYGNRNNTFYHNIFSANIQTGIYITHSMCMNNLFYNNSFISNGLNAHDNGENNHWNTSQLGNYWSNYTELGVGAEDSNDNLIGDLPYIIKGSASAIDFIPIWDDGDDIPPDIMIYSPFQSAKYKSPPIFSLSFYDRYSINTTWYTILGINANITFLGNSVVINQDLWEGLSDGPVIIRICVNDSKGHFNSLERTVIKKSSSSDDENNGDEFPLLFAIMLMIIIILFGLLVFGVLFKRRDTIAKEEEKDMTEAEVGIEKRRFTLEKPILDLTFKAYSGKKPFIFVSYAHSDKQIVYPEMKWIRDNDFKIWYDEGIPLTKEWPAEIEKAINNCSFFIAFLTSNAVESKMVRREINFAIKQNKPFLGIFLEPTELKHGLGLLLEQLQCIMKYEVSDVYYQQKVLELLKSHFKDKFKVQTQK